MVLHVIIAFLLMGLYVGSTCAICVLSWRDGVQVFGVVWVLVMGAMGLWSFVVAAFSDPGHRVDLLWDRIKPEEDGEESKDCPVCEDLKPPRTHHCSRCNRCVFRYDHHCRWLNNCVGQLNHKAFLLTIVYFWLAGVVVLIFHMWRFFMVSREIVWSIAPLVIFSVAFFCIVLHWGSLCFMAWLQISLLLKGMTQVEYHCCRGEFWQCHFDRGLRENVEAVFGTNRWLWLLPNPRYDVAKELSLRFFIPSIPRPAFEEGEEQDRQGSPVSPSLNLQQSGTASLLLSNENPEDRQSMVPESNTAWLERASKFDGGAFDWVQESSNE